MTNIFFNKILLNENIYGDLSTCKHFIDKTNIGEQIFENFKISDSVTITSGKMHTKYYDETIWKSNKNEIVLHYIISGSTKIFKNNVETLNIVNENDSSIFYSNLSMENEVHYLQTGDFSLTFPSQAQKFGICLDTPELLTYVKFIIKLSEV